MRTLVNAATSSSSQGQPSWMRTVIAPAVHDACRHVQERIAESLGLGGASSPSRQSALVHAMRSIGAQDELEPRVVRDDVSERQVAQAHRLGVADAVLDAGVAAMAQLECAAIARRVRDEALVAHALFDVEEGELCTGVGTLASERARVPRPSSTGR